MAVRNSNLKTSSQQQSNGTQDLPGSDTQGGAYVLLGAGDIVVSNDSVTAPMWSNNDPSLNIFYTSSTQVSSNVQEYYTSVFQTASTETSAEIQFDIAYGDLQGSGSQFLNNLVTGSTPTRTNYGQYRNLVLGDEDASFIFANATSSYWYAMPIERARYKQSILPGTWTMGIRGYNATTVTTAIVSNIILVAPIPVANVAGTVIVTAGNVSWFFSDGTADTVFQGYWDALTTPTVTVIITSDDVTSVQFCDAGRIYQIISGSAGVLGGNLKNTNGYTNGSGSYGYMLPDINTLILNGEALDAVPQIGGINFGTSRSFDSKGENSLKMVNALNRAGDVTQGTPVRSIPFTINSKEDLTSDFLFCRARNSEFNYSANPSFISSSTGAVLYSSFIQNPTTYITTVGLYNQPGDLLAVAKLSRPLEKNFTKELLVRVKLDF